MKPALTILVDTREQRPPPFPEGVTVERATLGAADYTTPRLKDIARIERKSLQDLVGSLGRDRDRFMRMVARLDAFAFRMIVVEAEIGSIVERLYRGDVHPNALVGTICSIIARNRVPVFFAGDPPTAGRVIAGILRRLEEEHAAGRVGKAASQ